MTGVEADETVEVVAPCIMGTFIQGESDERQRTRMWAGRRRGDRNDMVTMAKCVGSKVMAQVQ